MLLRLLERKDEESQSKDLRVKRGMSSNNLMMFWYSPAGSRARSRPGCAREAGAPRNASPAQETDRSVPDDEEQPLPRER